MAFWLTYAHMFRSGHRMIPFSACLLSPKINIDKIFEDEANGLCWWFGYGVWDKKEGLKMASRLLAWSGKMSLPFTEMGNTMGGTSGNFFLEVLSLLLSDTWMWIFTQVLSQFWNIIAYFFSFKTEWKFHIICLLSLQLYIVFWRC